MTKRPFKKPATTYADQVALLQSRGMIVSDVKAACFYLQHINYYRLGAYWLPFEANHSTHEFKPGTTFEAVLKLYTFDRQLRLLIMDALERIEVSVRAQWTYHMAHNHGAHSHLDKRLANNAHWYEKNLETLEKEVDRADEIFIQHMKDRYQEPLPPIWAVCEVMSLGLLSKWYDNLKPKRTRRAISSVYQVDEDVLASWLRHLTIIRNICAHHSRLWNRYFATIPMPSRNKPASLKGEFIVSSRKLYNTLVIILHFMDIISPKHRWRKKLKTLLLKHAGSLAAMGFPADWEKRRIWQE